MHAVGGLESMGQLPKKLSDTASVSPIFTQTLSKTSSPNPFFMAGQYKVILPKFWGKETLRSSNGRAKRASFYSPWNFAFLQQFWPVPRPRGWTWWGGIFIGHAIRHFPSVLQPSHEKRRKRQHKQRTTRQRTTWRRTTRQRTTRQRTTRQRTTPSKDKLDRRKQDLHYVSVRGWFERPLTDFQLLSRRFERRAHDEDGAGDEGKWWGTQTHKWNTLYFAHLPTQRCAKRESICSIQYKILSEKNLFTAIIWPRTLTRTRPCDFKRKPESKVLLYSPAMQR